MKEEELQELSRLYAAWSTDDLTKSAGGNAAQFAPEALVLLQAELKRRNISSQTAEGAVSTTRHKSQVDNGTTHEQQLVAPAGSISPSTQRTSQWQTWASVLTVLSLYLSVFITTPLIMGGILMLNVFGALGGMTCLIIMLIIGVFIYVQVALPCILLAILCLKFIKIRWLKYTVAPVMLYYCLLVLLPIMNIIYYPVSSDVICHYLNKIFWYF